MAINLGDAVLSFRVDDAPLNSAVAGLGPKVRRASREAEKGLSGFGAGLRRIKQLALGVGLVFVGWKVIQVLKDAAKAAIEFGKEFANVATLINTQTPVGVKQLKILKQQIFELRPELGSATELTRGLYQALSAGVAPAQAVRLVGEAALFAKAGLTDTLTAVDVLTTVINAYGLSVEKAASVSSVLFKTIEEGKITGEELSSSLGRVISAAAQLNIDLPELNAGIATMTKSGISAAEAMTTMVAILRTFTTPEATKRFEELGISQAKMRDIIAKDGLNAALQELGKLLKGDTAATTNLFRETEAQKGIFILLGKGADEYKRALGVLKKAQEDATATTIAADKQFDTLDERFKAITVTIEKEFIIAFENMSPAIEAVLVSFGTLGARGENLRIILNAVAWSIISLTQVFIFWKGLVEGVILTIFQARLAIAEFVLSNETLFRTFGILAIGVTQLRETVDNLKGSIKTDIDLIEKLEIQLAKMSQELEFVAETGEKTKKTLDDLGGAAAGVGFKFDLAAAGIARFRGENAALIEQFEAARFKQSLEELNQGLGEIPLNLELAAEGIGVFVEPTEEQLEAMRQALADTGISFTDMAQQATDAFNQIAGSVQGAGGVMLRVMGLIVGQILRNIAMNQALAASTTATEAAKAGSIIKAVKEIALVKAIFEMGEGFADLAKQQYWKAAKHFAASAFYGAVGALQVAAVAGAFGGGREGGGAPGAGAGAAPVRGQVAGDTAEPLEVERRMQAGGIITRPTLALLGEQAPAIKEAVIPFRTNQPGGVEEGAGAGGGLTLIVEGTIISADTLLELMQQMSELVRSGDAPLQASDSFNVVSRS
jgi:TP901 family phage tail tape measure protein